MDSKHELEKVNWGVMGIYNYKGTLIEKLIGGYRVLGRTCNTPDEVDEIIREACSSLSESIPPDRSSFTVKGDNGSFACIGGVNSGDSALIGDNLSDGR